MSRFGPDPRAFFDAVYLETAPWDIGAPQPALSALFADHPPSSPILDVGCGSGDLALSLARGGHQVLGIDFVPAAIEQARERMLALPPEVADRVELQVADALHPSALGRRFAAIVDSGFYHLFEPDVCDRFADELASALVPGGRYYLLAFAVEFPIPNSPRQITAEELQARFTPQRGWRIVELRSAEFQSQIAPVPATAACIERLPES